MFITAAVSGMTKLRNTMAKRMNDIRTTSPMNSGSLDVKHVGEVDEDGRGPAHQDLDPGVVHGLGDGGVAEVVDQIGRGRVLRC